MQTACLQQEYALPGGRPQRQGQLGVARALGGAWRAWHAAAAAHLCVGIDEQRQLHHSFAKRRQGDPAASGRPHALVTRCGGAACMLGPAAACREGTLRHTALYSADAAPGAPDARLGSHQVSICYCQRALKRHQPAVQAGSDQRGRSSHAVPGATMPPAAQHCMMQMLATPRANGKHAATCTCGRRDVTPHTCRTRRRGRAPAAAPAQPRTAAPQPPAPPSRWAGGRPAQPAA